MTPGAIRGALADWALGFLFALAIVVAGAARCELDRGPGPSPSVDDGWWRP